MIQLNLHTGSETLTARVPECWNELNEVQLVLVSDILYGEPDPTVRDIRIARALCGVSWKLMLQIDEAVLATDIFPLISWVKEACDLTKQLLPRVADYYGPAECLSNLKFSEFDFAERALNEWHKAVASEEGIVNSEERRVKSEECERLLCLFIATIYRPAREGYDVKRNPEGDVREAFNANLTAEYAGHVAERFKPAERYAILLWYKGSREYISQRYPRLFSRQETNQSEVAGEVAYFDLIRIIAKGGIYGTFGDVEQLWLYTALEEMERSIEEAEQTPTTA